MYGDDFYIVPFFSAAIGAVNLRLLAAYAYAVFNGNAYAKALRYHNPAAVLSARAAYVRASAALGARLSKFSIRPHIHGNADLRVSYAFAYTTAILLRYMSVSPHNSPFKLPFRAVRHR